MYAMSPSPADSSRPFLTWQRVIDWAQEHYRMRTFNKDEKIPVRPGLLYLVQRGAVRLVGASQISAVVGNSKRPASLTERSATTTPVESEDAFLGFVGAGQPFEIVAQSPFTLQSYAHVDQTTVVWMYWNDLDNWPHFRREVLDAFRYQHQRKLLWLSTLGQRRTIDRLYGFLTLLVEEYGEQYENGLCLPWALTHAQIGSAIGSTRVTVTRLMGKLRQRGLIQIRGESQICMPGRPTSMAAVALPDDDDPMDDDE